MKALVFGVPPEPFEVPDDANLLTKNLTRSPVGSNAFGIEEVDGQRKHAIAHYLDLVVDGRVDLRPMLTHTFRLDQWRDAFPAIANQGCSGAIKVAIDRRSRPWRR